jgi:hypothetical protein
MKNKSLILITILLAGAAIPANAQNDDRLYRERFTGGLKIGTNYSNVYDSEGDDFNADGKLGLAAGVFFTFPVGPLLGIQPEVLFSQKGFRATGSFLGSSYEMKRTTNYLDIPLFIAIKPMEFVTILVGPQFSYLMSRNDKFTNGSFTSEEEEQFDNDDFRKNTVCFVGGLDVNVNHLVVGGRVGWDLFNNTGDGSSDSPRYKNVWAQLTIGFRL